jgi:hypothetical protein
VQRVALAQGDPDVAAEFSQPGTLALCLLRLPQLVLQSLAMIDVPCNRDEVQGPAVRVTLQ